ncbi:hypothetical protein BDN71DRAFT_615787 [Pleurotus eryngii]|uniref:Uncharacterized protein n=1 Tax=Pleurotus eryngii TaxID=5323 RepID=A0A9P6A257_PLEER|nr:hypothetical protein BDN71DRAFT_615787 [Pleurotus eryngii]
MYLTHLHRHAGYVRRSVCLSFVRSFLFLLHLLVSCSSPFRFVATPIPSHFASCLVTSRSVSISLSSSLRWGCLSPFYSFVVHPFLSPPPRLLLASLTSPSHSTQHPAPLRIKPHPRRLRAPLLMFCIPIYVPACLVRSPLAIFVFLPCRVPCAVFHIPYSPLSVFPSCSCLCSCCTPHSRPCVRVCVCLHTRVRVSARRPTFIVRAP